MDRCNLCRGYGTLMCVQAGSYEWHTCPACGGAGTRVLFGPPTIRVRHAERYMRPDHGKPPGGKADE